MQFGKWLKAERKKKGFTLQQVADAGNTTKGQIHDLESGRTIDPKLSTLKTMASVMGVRLSTAIRKMEEMEKQGN